MSAIASIDVRLFHIPLAEVLVDAKHGDHHIFELITATVHLEDGIVWHRIYLHRRQRGTCHCCHDFS